MISTRSRSPRRLLLLGLILSLLIHVFGGALLGLFERVLDRLQPHQLASLREPVKTDQIQIENKPAAAAAAAKVQPVHPPPPPTERITPEVHPAPPNVRHEIARIVIHAPRQTAPSRNVGASEVPQQQPASGPRTPPHRYYSDEQITQMTDEFSKTIASVHQDAQSVTAQIAANAHVETIKHYEFHYAGIHEGMNPGDGYINYISKRRSGNEMIYMTHYIFMYGDGHVEEDDIPWPFIYPIGQDELAHCDEIHALHPGQYCAVHLQPPPPDYKPDRPLKPVLEQFFGGPPVS